MSIKIQLEKTEGIGTKMRYFVIIFVASILLSCTTNDVDDEMGDWTLGYLEFAGLQQLDLNNIEAKTIEIITADYRRNPRDLDYAELELFRFFFDEQSKHTILVFDILYVDDVQVVYEIDAYNKIAKKYLNSLWN